MPWPLARNSTEEADVLAPVLAPLADIEGIRGSFVISQQGELLLWDMPQDIGEEALDGVAPRLARLRDALTRDGAELELCMLRFAKQRLCLRAAGSCLIGVVTLPAINVAALKMALNVTAKRLDRLLTEE
jgi:predicted regulator of Ras-like GTPase activity (Roadblock/LC7/MglB family)